MVHFIDLHHPPTLVRFDEVFNFEFNFVNTDICSPESGLILIRLNRLTFSKLVILGSHLSWIFVRTIYNPLPFVILIQHSSSLFRLGRRLGLISLFRRIFLLFRLRLRLRFGLGPKNPTSIGSLRLFIWHLTLFYLLLWSRSFPSYQDINPLLIIIK